MATGDRLLIALHGSPILIVDTAPDAVSALGRAAIRHNLRRLADAVEEELRAAVVVGLASGDYTIPAARAIRNLLAKIDHPTEGVSPEYRGGPIEW